MSVTHTPGYLMNLLRGRIDITHIPFSDRGSRLLIYQEAGESRLYVKLAERLVGLEPGLEAYRFRPPFIYDLTLLDERGDPLEFQTMTYPHALYFQTSQGEFGLVFQERQTLSIGLPAGITAGLRFKVTPQFWHTHEKGGMLKGIRNLVYSTNGEIVHNQIEPTSGSYTVELLVQAASDTAITLTVRSQTDGPHETKPFSVAYAAAVERWEVMVQPPPARRRAPAGYLCLCLVGDGE